ncbi:MAG: GntR family transcriptional regulator [Candidatus Marinimicrobia bacterium]|nr:GntR family transcriptional regulator [Candidatus Neomarinimicrobiota bacterium]
MDELLVGQINVLTISEEKDFGLLLDTEEGRILLPRREMPGEFEIGESIEVFVYRDSEDRLIATTIKPLAMVGLFAALIVREISPIGTFLDWGLQKDLFIPPRLQLDPLVPGQRVVVKVLLDEVSDRIIATSKLRSQFDRDVKDLSPGKKVRTLIYAKAERGWRVVIDDQYQGMIFHNDFFKEPKIGDEIEAFIKKTRPDGLVDCTLRKGSTTEVKEKAPTILKMLKDKGGFLPYHDKSDPQLIADVFSMSKKTFKKSIGALKKKKIIEIEKDGIRLL